jgi:hypothetical protein
MSEESVFNFEGNLERAFGDYLKSKQLDVSDSNTRQVLDGSFIAGTVTIGEATGKAIFKPGGESEYSQYEFTLEITVGTQGVEDSPVEDFKTQHQKLVALVRMWLAVSNARGVLDDFLTLYEINTLTPSGTERTVDNTNNFESVLTFEGQFSILTTAFDL